MNDVLFIIDERTGDLTVAGLTDEEARALTRDLLPAPLPVGCARPARRVDLAALPAPAPGDVALRVFGLWHGSVVEGPGRRSVVQTSGCTLRCPGCIAEEAWDIGAGRPLAVAAVATVLLDPDGAPRDGITVLGGEPFEQPEALAALLAEVRRRAPGLHLTVYSGYTLATLARRPEPAVRRALDLADLLIDGPFVQRLAEGAGEWRGSRNQGLIPHPGRRLAAPGR